MNKNAKKESQPPNNKAGITEVVSLDIDTEGETPIGLDAETTADLLQDAQEENYVEEIGRHTNDPAIQESLAERQDLNDGQEQMQDRLEEHHATSPTLSGGDVDAAWDDANVGEETAGGMAPTPDQDMVEEIGEAYGITYEDDEPLKTGEKLAERDEHRWELDPESVEE
jgi:hypothetical protein